MAAVVNLLQVSTITGEGAAEAVSRETRSRSDSLVGNSVDAGTGAFVEERQVLFLDGGRPLSFNLTYNSLLTTERGPMGFGWSHNYEAFLEGDPEGTVTVHWNRNFKNSFVYVGQGQPYAPVDEAVLDDELIPLTSGRWRLTKPDGTRYEFAANGELTRVSNRIHQYIDLVRTGGQLTSIREAVGGKEIFLNYTWDGNELLQSIEDPLGRMYFFLYDDDQRLTQVFEPAEFGPAWGDFIVPKSVPDNNPGGLIHTIVVSEDDPIGLVEITLGNISHSRIEDLTVTLTSPEGNTVLLHDRTPGEPNLIFDKLTLAAFQGESPEGRWNLSIVDSQAGSAGTLNGWRMRFSGETNGFGYTYDSTGLNIDESDTQAAPAPGNLAGFRERNGDRINFEVTGSSSGSIWGTGVYTDDSNLAKAAVHAGLLEEFETGIITVTILPGQDSYSSSTQNGVSSSSWGSWVGSYALSRYVPTATASLSSRLVRVTGPDGEQLYANTYDGEGRVATQDDGVSTNLIAEFTYRDIGSGVETTYRNRLGDEVVFEHDDEFHLLSVTDPLGHRTTWDYNTSGDRVRRTDALGNATLFNYDDLGNLVTMVDPAGAVTTFTYDVSRNVIRIRDALGNETNFTYNNDNNLTFVTDAAGIRDEKIYGGSGYMSGIIVADGAGMNFRYRDGKLNSTTHPAESGSSGLEYDDAGRLTRVVDFDGFATEYEYDRNDRVVRETDSLGNSSPSTFDRRNRLIRRVDLNGNESSYAYDGNDNLVEETNPLGQTTRFEYDGEDRRVRVIDARGNATTIAYDAAGRVIKTVDPLGNSVRFEYDPLGNRTAVYDGREIKIAQIAYDERQLPVSSQDALGHTTHAVYDSVGRLRETADALGRRSVFGYDELDRPVEARDPLNRTSRQAFTGDDFTRELTNHQGATTAFEYDAANRLNVITTSEGNRTNLTYNKRDLITRVKTAEGRELNFSFDAEGRLTRLTKVAPGILDPDLLYSYDANGNLLTVSRKAFSDIEPVPRLRRTYDALDRMTSYTDGRGNRLDYEYDETGNLAALVYPDGKRVTYLYDAANRLTTVTDWAGRVTRYTYDPDDRIKRVEFPNGTLRRLNYDANGRIAARYDTDAGGGLIVGYRYSYDPAGQVNVETHLAPSTPFTPADVSMAYDEDNRLTSINGQTVSFDRDGNMTRGPLGSTFGDYRYDANQNLRSAGGANYFYDEEDRLVGFLNEAGTTELVQDPRGRLSQVMQKTDPDGSRTRYVYGVGLAYEEQGGTIRVFHYDERGSTTALTSNNGSVVGRVSYGPFGEIAGRTGETDSLFLYHGLFGVITDPQGLNYMRARWYSPQIRRFVNQDPHFGDIAKPGSLNRFAFGLNNPAVHGDPSGEFGQILVGALVGAAAGAATVLVKSAIKGEKVDWAEVGGAAIGGAVTGALVAACGPCGLGATIGVGFAAGALGGAANVASRELLFRGKKLEDLDPVEVGVEIGISAVAGAIGAGVGKAVANALAPATTTTIVGPSGPIVIASFSRTFTRAAILGAAAGVAEGVTTNLVLGLAQEPAESALRGTDSKAAAQTQSPAGNRRVLANSLRELNEGKKGAFGEFRHWQLYLNALKLAGRPAPNNPNNMLATF